MEWDANKGYQLSRAKAAIGSGGWTGEGLGRGPFVRSDPRISYIVLPENHNDFIFSMIANQWGLAGALMVVICYLAISIIGCDIATLTNDPFGRLLAVGLATMIGFQAFTNLFVNLGLGPVTGITLPFVSAGGSSMIASLLMIGLLLSVAHRRPMLIARRPFEFDDDVDEAAG
jgi:rod shape determining protein RodA